MITVKANDKTYKFEFNNQTAAELETSGFDVAELRRCVNSMSPDLVFWAAKMHQPDIGMAETTELLRGMKNGVEFVVALMGEYQAATEALVGEKEQGFTFVKV